MVEALARSRPPRRRRNRGTGSGDRELALSVARQRIDYHAAVSGNLRLVPSGTAQRALAEDYGTMLPTGMLLDDDEPFDTLMQRCALIEERANAHAWGRTD